jgi:hypothetical protein
MSSASIEILERGWVAPMTMVQPDGLEGGERFDGGVYYSDGKVCDLGLQIKPAKNVPLPVGPADLLHVEGHHVFGGLLQNLHFGHFLVESLARLWAFDHLENSYRSVIYNLRVPGEKVAAFASEMLEMLVPEANVRIVRAPTEFEMLAVPQELVQPESGFMYGHPMIRTMCNRLRFHHPAGGPKKIYLSRARLPKEGGGILGDHLIDEYLKEEGYTILYPETMTVREQVEVYLSAEHLIFAEGSAIHLYALVATPKQRAFVIYRRRGWMPFAWQMRTFGGPVLQGNSCVEKLWEPESTKQNKAWANSVAKAVLNFGMLSNQLFEAGFIARAPWPEPETAALQAELAAVEMEKPNRKYILIRA